MSRRLTQSLALLLLLSGSGMTHGFEPRHDDETGLGTIVVTPTRTARTVDQTLAMVTIIEREEIERLDPQQFSDLLRGRAGVTFSQNGAFGKQSSVFMRGSNAGHTLLLVDGVRMGSATAGVPAWEFLPMAEIDRVEIVRGPRTSLYGSDAIGGVIQIFTRQGDGPARIHGHLRAGSMNTRDLGVGIGGSNAQTRYSLSLGDFRTDGVDVLDGIGDDRADGLRSTTLSSQLSHRVHDRLELFGSLLYTEGEAEFDQDDFFAGRTQERDWDDFVNMALRGGMRMRFTDAWRAELSLASSRDERDTHLDGQFSSRFDTRRRLATWQNDIALHPGHLLTLGLDYQDDRVFGTTPYDRTRRDNWGFYGQLQSQLGRHSLAGSLRLDDNEAFGSHTTGQVAWGYELSPFWESRASYGTAFKAPTFNDLYFPGFANPDLSPETSQTYELGLAYANGRQYADLAVFHSRIEDLILFVFPRPENVQTAVIRGLELQAGWEWQDWSLSAAYTHLDHENRDTRKELNRRPRDTARLDLDWRQGPTSLGASVIGEGRRYNDAANLDRISGHGLLNLRASYRLSRPWTLRASIDNALDKEYSMATDFSGIPYAQPGRAYYLSLHYQQ